MTIFSMVSDQKFHRKTTPQPLRYVIISLLSIILVCSSCSSVRMRLDADVQADNGQTGKVSYENSYDLGSIPTLCALTGIFFGGACWFYFTYPNVEHMEAAERDVAKRLDQQFGEVDYSLSQVRVDSKGWEDSQEYFKFTVK